MPIRINLLAEAIELEELRRRDPVKRAIYIACGIIGLFLVWSASKQVLIFAQQRRLTDLETQIKQASVEYSQVHTNQQKLKETQSRLDSLTLLATNRLLQGNVLNALQKATVDEIQVTRLKVIQSYRAIAAEKPKVIEATGRTIPGTPASTIEQVNFSIEARDNSLRPGEEVLNNWRQSLGDAPFFRDLLARTNEFRLTSRSPPQVTPASQKPFVTLTLESRVPDRIR